MDMSETLARLKTHEHDGIPTFLFDCQRCADLDAVEREITRLRWDLQHQCEANARLQKKVRPWWQRWT